LLAADCEGAALGALTPLCEHFLPLLLNPNHSVSLATRLLAVKLVMVLMRSNTVYRCARQALSDGSSLLRYVAFLMSMDHNVVHESATQVLALRLHAVRLFGTIVVSYTDWSDCTCATDTGGSGSVAAAAQPVEGDLGPRLIQLLYEHILLLRAPDRGGPCAALVADVVFDSFTVMAECAKDPMVEASFHNKMFRQLYLSSLVALSSEDALLHASLAPLRVPAKLLLGALHSKQ
jgi:hypothetical protein